MALPFALALVSVSALRLVAAAGLDCPEPSRVRAYLGELGLGANAPDTIASWRREDASLRLTILRGTAETATAGALLERDLPPATCDEWTAPVALAIERATQPLTADASDDAPTLTPARIVATPPEADTGRGLDVGVHAGPLVRFAARTGFGGDLGAEAWPKGGPFGIAILAGGVLPENYAPSSSAGVSLSLSEIHAGLGGALRFLLGEHVRIGTSVMGLVAQVRGTPGCVDGSACLANTQSIRDVRAGGRAAGWIGLVLGPIELRLEGAVRGMPDTRTYRAIPFIELARLPAIDGELLFAAGIARF
jgi:hypothetical protein